MKNLNTYFLLLLSIFSLSLFSCKKTENKIFWINSLKYNCDAGAGKKMCLKVFEGNSLDSANWVYFYNDIQGFKFETGYYQKIEIIKEKKSNTPQDVSEYNYKLKRVIEKNRDKKIILNDIWVAKSILKNPLYDKHPTIEIHLSKSEILGNNGCNNFRGVISEVNDSLINFKNITTSKKTCPNMMIYDLFEHSLYQTKFYNLNGTQLTFYDKHHHELIKFIKVD